MNVLNLFESSLLVEYLRNLLHASPPPIEKSPDPLAYALLLLDILQLLQLEESPAEIMSAQSGQETKSDLVTAYIDYIAEVYLYPIPLDSTESTRLNSTTTWRSPLSCSAKVPSLKALCKSRNDITVTRNLATLVCEELIEIMNTEPVTSTALHPTPSDLLFHFHSNISIPLVTTISAALETRRMAATSRLAPASPVAPSILTFRWILSSILNGHFPNDFAIPVIHCDLGTREDNLQGSKSEDEMGIELRWKLPIEVESDSEEIGDKVQEAKASISRKDDKLTWIFGQNEHGPSSRTKRPQTAPAHSHYRLSSVSSSAPLLSPPRNREARVSSSFEENPPIEATFGNLITTAPKESSSNSLSTQQKSEGVRRAKKLNKLFGSPIEENAARILIEPRPEVQPRRRSSFPPDSPSFSPLPTAEQIKSEARLDRRRRIAKLQDLLGERVLPEDLDSSTVTSLPMSRSGSSMSRNGSSRGSRMIGEMIRGAKEFRHKKSSSTATEQWIVVDQQAVAEQIKSVPTIASEEPVSNLEELVRLRKLENVFGSVPRYSRPLSASGRRASLPLSPVLSSSGESVSLRYQSSIASLRKLLEEEVDITRYYDRPDTTEEPESAPISPGLANLINRSSEPILLSTEAARFSTSTSSLQSAYEPIDPRISTSSTNTTTTLKRTTSTTSTQKIKQATKLAGFFGTTRGDVWTCLLDDLELEIREEEEMEEDERSQVLSNLKGLRDSRGG